MRFNVVYNGKRTTARLPDDLWELFVLAMDSDRLNAVSEVLFFFGEREEKRKLMDSYYTISASEALRSFVTGYLRRSLPRVPDSVIRQ